MKNLIAIPCLDMVYVDFMLSLLGLKEVDEVCCLTEKSSLVYHSRNVLAQKAIDGNFDRVLWLDSDIIFDSNLMQKMSSHLNGGLEFVSGLYFKRTFPTEPVCYEKIIQKQDGNELSTEIYPYKYYPQNCLFEVEATGFGAVMMNTDLLKRVSDKYGLPFSPCLGLGEDLSFCWRARQLGVKLYCDSSIILKHIGNVAYTESTYLEQISHG